MLWPCGLGVAWAFATASALGNEARSCSLGVRPEWCPDPIEQTCSLEDRVPERRVFQGITEASAYQVMSRACKNAKVRHYR